jgi:glycosyltransferase involved in cell wall biosynthesis
MPSIKVCFLGDFSDNFDEGYKNSCHYLAGEVEKYNPVLRINIKSINLKSLSSVIQGPSPRIIHAISQPTYKSLYFLKFLSLFVRKSKTVVSALKPEAFFRAKEVGIIQKILMSLVKPNIVLAQSSSSAKNFEKTGCKTALLHNGVDTNRFIQVPPSRKIDLRRKYKLIENKPVVLHIGHLEVARNLLALEPLVSFGFQVVIVGSLYMGIHKELIEDLRNSGLRIVEGYQPNVEEFYQLADCYVFPLEPGNSLSMPLSVLEAMACNLPVVTRRFAGLVENFKEGNGLFFVDHDSEIAPAVQKALDSHAPIETRTMVLPYSWISIAQQLLKYYSDLIEYEDQ